VIEDALVASYLFRRHGEAQRQPPDRRPARLRSGTKKAGAQLTERIRRRRPYTASCCWTMETAHPDVFSHMSCCRSWKKGGRDRTASAGTSTFRQRADHDLTSNTLGPDKGVRVPSFGLWRSQGQGRKPVADYQHIRKCH